MTHKTYADGKGPSYTYSVNGKLLSRAWARPGNLVTAYSYHPLTGELLSIDYSDSPPDITFTYNRLGQQKSVADAVGSRSFGYNSAFQLTSESIGGIYNKMINRTYSDSGFKGRYTGMDTDDTISRSTGKSAQAL